MWREGVFDLNTADHSSYNAEFDTPVAGHTGRSWGFSDKKTPDSGDASEAATAVFVSWKSDDPTEWLAAGYWMELTFEGSTETIKAGRTGAFVKGPELASRHPASPMPTEGEATYSGFAGGILAYGNPSATVEVSEVLGTVEFTVTFEPDEVAIEGAISGLRPGLELTLERSGALQTGEISQHFVTPLINGEEPETVNQSRWTGWFSTTTDDGGVPRLLAGTAGADWEEDDGTKGSFLGAFIATKQ
ncbi:MAG: hypothetical protein OXN81_00440 [Alphaproteobacteria bacterium]|nr:hypothetical protein [Alphaproteobacteria bacterium]